MTKQNEITYLPAGYSHLQVQAWRDRGYVYYIWPFHLRNFWEAFLKGRGDDLEVFFWHGRLGPHSPNLLKKISSATQARTFAFPGGRVSALRFPALNLPGLLRFRQLLSSADYVLLPVPSAKANAVEARLRQVAFKAKKHWRCFVVPCNNDDVFEVHSYPVPDGQRLSGSPPDIHAATLRLLKDRKLRESWNIKNVLINHDDDMADIFAARAADCDNLFDYTLRNFLRNAYGTGYFKRLPSPKLDNLRRLRLPPLPATILRRFRRMALKTGLLCYVRDIQVKPNRISLRCWQGLPLETAKCRNGLGSAACKLNSFFLLEFDAALRQWQISDEQSATYKYTKLE